MSELFESRRNPQLNSMGKELVIHSLKKYAGIENVFGSYTIDVGKTSHPFSTMTRARNTSGFKLGINPESDWVGTPLGIYAYPIDYIIKMNRNVPYSKSKKFLIIFKAFGNIIVGSQYTSENLKSDLEKLENISEKNGWDKEKYEKILSSRYDPAWAPIECLWNIINKLYNLSKKKAGYWNKLFRELGYDGVIDDGIGFIYYKEPTQAVFFTTNTLKILEVIDNKTSGNNAIGLSPDEDFDED